jgi:hypothetical protein
MRCKSEEGSSLYKNDVTTLIYYIKIKPVTCHLGHLTVSERIGEEMPGYQVRGSTIEINLQSLKNLLHLVLHQLLDLS